MKNIGLCDELDEDDFELVLVDEAQEDGEEEESKSQDDINPTTKPDTLNKTFV